MKLKYKKPRNLEDIRQDQIDGELLVEYAGYDPHAYNENGNEGAYEVWLNTGWCFEEATHLIYGTLKHVCREMGYVKKCKPDCPCRVEGY